MGQAWADDKGQSAAYIKLALKGEKRCHLIMGDRRLGGGRGGGLVVGGEGN